MNVTTGYSPQANTHVLQRMATQPSPGDNPDPKDSANIGGQQKEEGPSMGAKIGSKILNVGIGAGVGAAMGHYFRGSMKAALAFNAIPIAIGATGIGIVAGGFAAMVAAKNGESGTNAFLKWGGITALATGALLVGATVAGQALTNALPWDPMINGAVMGGVGGLLGSGVDWTKVSGVVKAAASKGKEETKVDPPSNPPPPAVPPADDAGNAPDDKKAA